MYNFRNGASGRGLPLAFEDLLCEAVTSRAKAEKV
jgi:hypothetical protein